MEVAHTWSAEEYDRTNEDYDPVMNEIQADMEEEQERLAQQFNYQKELDDISAEVRHTREEGAGLCTCMETSPALATQNERRPPARLRSRTASTCATTCTRATRST